MLFILLGLGIVALFTLAFRSGILETYPAQSAPAALAENPAVLARVNFRAPASQPFLLSIIGDAAGALTGFAMDSLPYEGAWAAYPRAEEKLVRMETAVTLRRFSGLLESRADAELWRWFSGQQIDQLGLERPGVWKVNSHAPLSEGALKEASAWQPQEDAPIPLAENEFFAAVVDNRHGLAYLALEPLLNPALQPGELPTVLDNRTDARGWAAWFAPLSQAGVIIRMEEQGHAGAELTLRAPDDAAAETLLALAEAQRDRMAEAIEKQGGWLDGHWRRDGRTIAGTFHVRDGQRLLRAWLLSNAL